MIKIEVTNAEELQMALSKASSLVLNAVHESLVTGAALAKEEAQKIVPVKTGNLKYSIFGKILERFTAVIGSDINYAVFVEYGTSRMQAQPYLRPAIEAIQIWNIMEQKITKALKTLGE